jgi:hypothetical protein
MYNNGLFILLMTYVYIINYFIVAYSCVIFVNSKAKLLLEEPVEDDTELKEELDKMRNMVEVARSKLSKKARAVGLMKRKLDHIPDRAELAQYQRRFVELSNEG